MLPKSGQRVESVLKQANEIAREYDQEYMGTEHMLLAIMKDGTGVGFSVLAERGISYDQMKTEVDNLVKKQLEETWVFGRLPGTPHFKNVMAAAIDQCQQLEAKRVCTEHLLLALLKEPGCVAQQTLKALGVKYSELRGDILRQTQS